MLIKINGILRNIIAYVPRIKQPKILSVKYNTESFFTIFNTFKTKAVKTTSVPIDPNNVSISLQYPP